MHDSDRIKKKGQASMESILLAPIFFLLAFMVLQLCHLGLGMAMVQYATTSVARQAVQDNVMTPDSAKFAKLMGAGLKDPTIQKASEDRDAVTANLSLVGCAKLTAYPLVGEALKTAHWNTSDGCTADAPMVSLTGGGPYAFIIRAKTTVRMNYQTK